ncbi:MAG: flavodoxin-dependent (E)-4-hydroxy-3-methylbut-2-enyl-diphosphate synthase [Bacillota bacterium]|nr:flavodoxin-dependent (E)-4-hydroxy-3-methylbut-2-enyl-diphosphate synthase [Bacillota bacterium]
MGVDKIKRKLTRSIHVGGLIIGGSAPVVIQSMTSTDTSDVGKTREQIFKLAEAGCELIRVAIPDENAVKALKKLVAGSPVPLVADIHFDARLAYMAIENGAAKIRINPGNIGGTGKLLELAGMADKYKVPIRIGVNAGSLNKKILQKYGGPYSAALVESALAYLEVLEADGFSNFVVSLKSSDVYTTISAYRLFSEKRDYPLHIGITEAGTIQTGIIKGAIGTGTLLAEGIGDTIRISLTASPVEEVITARCILQSLGLRIFGPELIACPTCGRCTVDLINLANSAEQLLKNYSIPIKVAVMGCAVNGPGEAKEADIGICAGKKRGMLFKHGKVVKTVKQEKLLEVLKEELDNETGRYNRQKKQGGPK